MVNADRDRSEAPHVHDWVTCQNVTTKGCIMSTYEVCWCGSERLVEAGTPTGAPAPSQAATEAHSDENEALRATTADRENRWPTPREFVDEWETFTDERRLAVAERIVNAAQTASQCFLRNHDALEAECEHLRAALVTARTDAIEEFAATLRAGLAEEGA